MWPLKKRVHTDPPGATGFTARDALTCAMTELSALTADLVSIPSHEDPTAAGDAIESWLREETDASVTRDDAGNVIARRGSGPRGG